MRERVERSAAVLAAAALLTAGLATAGAAAEPASETAAVRSVPVAGMQVAIDPATGRLRQPTAAESRQLLEGLRQMLKASPRAQTAQEHADGSLSMVLGDEYLSVYLAKVGADGRLAQACVDSADAAERFMSATGPAMEEK